MSLEAKADAGAASAAGETADSGGGAAGPSAGRETSRRPGGDLAGMILARLPLIPMLLAAAWLLAGMVFLAAGYFRPLPVTLLAVVLAVPMVWFGLRAAPGLGGRTALPGGGERTPWWTVAAIAVIVLAFFAQQASHHTQFVIITRDPGAYFQFGAWLAGHGSLPIPADPAAFGGTHGVLEFGGYATYQQGSTVVFQFMAALPMVLAGTMWAGGYHAALLAGPVLGTLAVVAFAGLAARLLGPRWAVLATLIVAVSLPMQFTSRSTYSEPLAMILFLGGLALLLDGLRPQPPGESPGEAGAARGARTAVFLGSLALGLTVLARIDGVSDVLPVIPYCGAMFVRRRPQAGWLAAGLTAGTAIGVAEGLVFSWPYLMKTNRASVLPLAVLTVVVIVVTVAGTLFFRRRVVSRDRPPQWWGWLPHAALPVAVVLAAVFWVRPHFQQVRDLDNSGTLVRTYAELSLHWVDWYLGIPVIAAAVIGAGLLARRCLRGQAGDWVLPLMVLSWATVIFLYRPAISADQPWGSRRMVPEIIPAFVLLAVWAIARGTAWLRDARSSRVRSGAVVRAAAAIRPLLVVACVLAVVLPAVIANWGLKLSVSNGVRLTADGLADKRDFQGELTAMQKLCAALPANATVILLPSTQSQQMMQDVRGMCGVPTAGASALNARGQRVMSDAHLAEVVKSSVVTSVERTGRVPVILAADQESLSPYQAAGQVRHVFTLNTSRDPGTYYGAPDDPIYQLFDIWMWTPSR